MNKLIRAMSLWRERLSQEDSSEQFRMIAALFLGSPYVWGSENPLKTDCSGLICGTFTIMGHPIRVTATDLYKSVFIKDTDSKYDPKTLKAWFLLANKDYDTPDGVRLAGTARHTGIVYGDNVLLHATYPRGTVVDTIDGVRKTYSEKDTSLVFREIDWSALSKMEGKVYGLDEELV